MIPKVPIKRFDKNIPLPEYKTSGAAGFDLSARVRQVILPRTIAYIPLNVAIEPPEGYFVLLAARSSLHKRGLMSANGIGIIDRDYSGNTDEYTAVLYNYTDAEVVVEAGDRIMQGVFVPHVQGEFVEVGDMGNKNRGGFGTTGK
jgi:dUTP pyrophosphatase